MDDGHGQFVQVPNEKLKEVQWKLNSLESQLDKAIAEREQREYISNLDGIFFVGEELEIKGSKFKIQAIHTSRIVLKLLPKKQTQEGL